jgi:uroporphyrin-III C-methyltransferase
MSQRGKVYLTGAGPGAADLLTVRAASLLARAEIVLYDSLISDQILRLCPLGCAMVAVGKHSALPTAVRQDEIHRRLEDAAQRYKTVVRLKGGDPCIFGRGGEELAFLTSRHIPWEVIPGISAGVGGLSALGLPLTHRELASSVTLLTGSQALSGAFRGLQAPVSLSPQQTLVIYMGFQHVAAIAADLLAHGLPASTFALCGSRLSAPDQRLLAAPLADIGAAVAAAKLDTPAVLVVGDVVGFWQSHIGPRPEESAHD